MKEEESKIIALKAAISEGMNSPLIEDFDFDENLKQLKAGRRKRVKVVIRESSK